jgi:hypothetical protein
MLNVSYYTINEYDDIVYFNGAQHAADMSKFMISGRPLARRGYSGQLVYAGAGPSTNLGSIET